MLLGEKLDKATLCESTHYFFVNSFTVAVLVDIRDCNVRINSWNLIVVN